MMTIHTGIISINKEMMIMTISGIPMFPILFCGEVVMI